MSTQNKQRNQRIVVELASLPGNNICADCKARLPRWTSHNLGIFICVNCASIHRKIGTHITKVKSLTMDEWTNEQVEIMKSIGNVKSNAIFNPNEIRNPPPPNLEDSERDSEIELYIRAKYEYKKFLDKSALVASKLGPSRKASTVPAPLPPAPLPPPISRSSVPVPKRNVATPTALTSSHKAPPKPPQVVPAAQPTQPSGGVWDDINSLKSNSQNSSLPLQYQQPSYSQGNPPTHLPAVNSAINTSSYPVGVTASGMGLNPYQPNQIRMNPFSQPQFQPPFPASPMTSPFSASSQPLGQFQASPTPPIYNHPQPQTSMQIQIPSGASAMSTMTTSSPPFSGLQLQSFSPIFNAPTTPIYMQPQPQTSLQIQNPSGQSLMSTPPIQPFPSAPAGQSQFLPSPQQIQPSSSPQFIYPSSASTQPQMGASAHSQFLGMTTMQMQQQQALQQQQQQQQQQQALQQQQMQQYQQLQRQHQQQLGQNYYSSMQQPQMMSGQVNSLYGQTSTYPQGGFPPQTGGQWGMM